MHKCVITLLYLTAVTSAFYMGLNDPLLNLGINQFDVSRTGGKKWAVQPLDHFDANENRTINVLYYENLHYWKPSGPIYLYLAGYDFIGPLDNDETYLWAQMAKETNGALFTTAHRYYTDSKPDIPNHDKIKYYKYLSSRQALADIANLIKKLKSDPKYHSSKVVVFGILYGGNLAAWMRALYPDLVDAALAVSAPVLAKKDFREYLDGVRYTFSKYGTDNCLSNVENTFKRYEELLKSESGIETLKKEFKICPSNDLTVLENQQFFFYNLAYDDLKVGSEAGYPYDVKLICDTYESNDKLMLNRKNKLRQNKRRRTLVKRDQVCNNVDFVSYDWASYPWVYQYCTEFGLLQTTSSEKQPFVHWNPMEFWLKTCKGLVEGDIEKRIDEGVAKTNAMYGGLTPKVSKVVFTYGDMDPGHVLGVPRDLAPEAPVVMVNATSVWSILVVDKFEPIEMRKKRKYVKDLIKKWIAD